ncbi:MAG TPA: mannosyltransferase family protein [Chloroflexota bacterium]|nr:mannosyltransferase family protein [Chloroflexota bacterium]
MRTTVRRGHSPLRYRSDGLITRTAESAASHVLSVASLIRGVMVQDEFRIPVGIFLLSRALFLLITYVGTDGFRVHAFVLTQHGSQHLWRHWDTGWYITIAEHGYAISGHTGSPLAFFPLFPLLIRAIMGATGLTAFLSAIVASNAAFLVALLYLWRLVCEEFSAAAATRSVLYVTVFPTALFFFAGYTESLFLALSVAAFYHLRRGSWLPAGCAAALASGTRVTGAILLAPFLYEYLRTHDPPWRPHRDLLGVLLVPAGLGAFMLYLAITAGDPLAFSHVQVHWHRVVTAQLWTGFAAGARLLVTLPPASFYQAHDLIDVGLGGGFLVLTIYAARILPAAYTIYAAAFWPLVLSDPALAGAYPAPLVSLSRYILALFPIFMSLGVLGRHPRVHESYLLLATAGLVVLAIVFMTGGWMT